MGGWEPWAPGAQTTPLLERHRVPWGLAKRGWVTSN